MTQHLTPDLIAEYLAELDEIWDPRSSEDTSLAFDQTGRGEIRATLRSDVEVDARTFRIVEVGS